MNMKPLLLTLAILIMATACERTDSDNYLERDMFDEVGVANFSDLNGYPGAEFPDVPDSLLDNNVYPLKYMNIHCTATRGDVTTEQLLAFWKDIRKWRKPGYNTIVHLDGSTSTPVPWNFDGEVQWSEVSYGVKGVNRFSVNVAYTGGIDSNGKPKDTRTPEQRDILAKIVAIQRCRWPDIKIMGHRDHPNVRKACPSFDARMEYNLTYDALEPDPWHLEWTPVVDPENLTDTVYWKGVPVQLNY